MFCSCTFVVSSVLLEIHFWCSTSALFSPSFDSKCLFFLLHWSIPALYAMGGSRNLAVMASYFPTGVIPHHLWPDISDYFMIPFVRFWLCQSATSIELCSSHSLLLWSTLQITACENAPALALRTVFRSVSAGLWFRYSFGGQANDFPSLADAAGVCVRLNGHHSLRARVEERRLRRLLSLSGHGRL